MNFYDYLGVKYANSQVNFNLTYSSVDINREKHFKFNGESIFSHATKQDLEKLDYKKLAEALNKATDENVQAEEEKTPLEFLMTEFLSLPEVKDAVDSYKDGEITEQELKDYIEELANKNGEEDLTLADFDKVLEDAEIDLEKLLEQDTPEYVQTYEPIQNTETYQVPQQNYSISIPPAIQNCTLPSYTPIFNSPVYNRDYNPTVQVDPLSTMSLSELLAEQTKRQDKVNEAQSKYSLALSGNTDAVKEAKQTEADAKKAYEQALKNDTAAKSFRKDITKNIEAIDNNQKKLDKNTADIANKEAELSKCEDSMSSAQNELSSMERALSSLNKAKEDDVKDLAAKKSSLNKEIAAKKKEIENLKKQTSKLNNELEALKEEKQKLEEEKVALQEQKTLLDAKVNELCSDATKEALEAYNTAKQHTEEVKQTEISEAKTELETAQKALKEVNEKVKTAQAAEISSKYSTAPEMDLSAVPESFRQANGVTEKTLPDGTKVLACRWSRFSHCQQEWLDLQKPMLQAAKDLGLTLVYSDVERTVAESNAGRAKKGNLVCKGGQSPHNYGVGADIVLFKDGKAVNVNSNLQTQFARKVQEYSDNRITWGGDWRKKGERHHFEVRNWQQKYKNPAYLVG